ncbi:MAG: hypothetical protein IJZ39_09075 [Oscillospiraceae bacterium]|nr:hypothetical protein [Oscillospiraceae bacterium]
MLKITLTIEGMMCPKCEARVSKAIETAFSVKEVKSSHEKCRTEILCEDAIAEDALRAVIPEGFTMTGYKCEKHKKFLFF